MSGTHLPWYVLAVRSRREAHVSCLLERLDYTVYLPTYPETRQYSDRLRHVQTALFPGYVFIRLDIRERLPVLMLQDVFRVLGDEHGPTAVPDNEIEGVALSMTSALPWQPWPFLQAGERVAVIAGPLRGVEGTLVASRGTSQLVLGVTLLQRAIAVAVERSWVCPVERLAEVHRAGGVARTWGAGASPMRLGGQTEA